MKNDPKSLFWEPPVSWISDLECDLSQEPCLNVSEKLISPVGLGMCSLQLREHGQGGIRKPGSS